jgi:hypothetical protein
MNILDNKNMENIQGFVADIPGSAILIMEKKLNGAWLISITNDKVILLEEMGTTFSMALDKMSKLVYKEYESRNNPQ